MRCSWLHFVQQPFPPSAMKKRTPPDSAKERAAKFRRTCAEAFLQNALSARQVRQIVEDATLAGASGVSEMARTGAHGSHPGNIHRDMIRWMRRGSPWPHFYIARTPLWCKKTQQVVWEDLPFLLPHEVLAAIVSKSGPCTSWLATADEHPGIHRHLARLGQELQVETPLVPLGLHGDGVPFGKNSQDSLEYFTINMPCFKEQPGLRLPLTMLLKSEVVKDQTFDFVMTILKWSLQWLARGSWPSARHDGTPFGASDRSRARKASLSLSCHAALVEIRGDWCFYKNVMRAPAWNEARGLCWRCTATPASYKDCSLTAHWRSEKLSPQDLQVRLWGHGLTPSPLFSAPGVSSDLLMPDWLHCADLGIACDVIGNTFAELVDHHYDAQRRWQRTKHCGQTCWSGTTRTISRTGSTVCGTQPLLCRRRLQN